MKDEKFSGTREICKEACPDLKPATEIIESNYYDSIHTDSRTVGACLSCLAEIEGDELLVEKPSNEDFHLRVLLGRIGEAMVEAIFSTFGYSVQSYGYENRLSYLIETLVKRTDSVSKRIRSMPDLLMVPKDQSQSYLIEVKVTHQDPKIFELNETVLGTYMKLWPEATLVVICMEDSLLYSREVKELETLGALKERDGKTMRVLNLHDDMYKLDKQFGFPSTEYQRLLNAMFRKVSGF